MKRGKLAPQVDLLFCFFIKPCELRGGIDANNYFIIIN